MTNPPGPVGAGPTPTADLLTHREWEVAGLLAEALSNRGIAARLSISRRTAESHVEAILVKLGMVSRVQVAAWYARNVRNRGE